VRIATFFSIDGEFLTERLRSGLNGRMVDQR
jgi:hypothetical protein